MNILQITIIRIEDIKCLKRKITHVFLKIKNQNQTFGGQCIEDRQKRANISIRYPATI